MKVFILNNTESYHCGSAAVMRVLRAQLLGAGCKILGERPTRELIDNVEDRDWKDADWVIANGEGTMHDNQPHAPAILQALRLAQNAGKRTALINSIWYNMGTEFARTVEALDFFSVREPLSAEQAEPIRQPEIFLDLCACLGFENDANMATRTKTKAWFTIINGKGSPLAPANEARGLARDSTFESWVTALGEKPSIYVTNEQHGVYAAGLAGAAFIPYWPHGGHREHKIKGLLHWAKLPIRIARNSEDLKRGLLMAYSCPELFSAFHRFLETAPKLDVGQIIR